MVSQHVQAVSYPVLIDAAVNAVMRTKNIGLQTKQQVHVRSKGLQVSPETEDKEISVVIIVIIIELLCVKSLGSIFIYLLFFFSFFSEYLMSSG